jgi:FkbM family methyltransferase
MKQFFRRTLGRLGYQLGNARPKPAFEETGFTDPFQAKQHLLNGQREIIIFDVGAYHGEMAHYYRSRFPDSIVYSFEPFAESFSALQSNTHNDSLIRTFNLGFSDQDGQSRFFSNSFAVTNSLLAAEHSTDDVWGKGVVQTKDEILVHMTTLDQFVSQHSIEKIDILKMDVQGAEHLVLAGATDTLEKNKVRMIYSEIITMPTYRGQKQLHEMLALYQSFGFELHSIYNPSFTSSGALRQMDCLLYRPLS